mgnify:CR=1 FL=1
MTTEDQKDTLEIEKVNEPTDGSAVVGEDPTLDAGDEGEDEKMSASEGDESAPHAESAEDAEARRERNRARRRENKESRKEYIEGLKRELAARDNVINDLSTRVASVERHSAGSQMANLDTAIKEAENIYSHFKSMNMRAIEAVDGATAVDAQEKMFAAAQRHQMLTNAKKNMVNQQQQPQPLDPRLKQHAEGWMQKNEWYDPSGADIDSDLVLKLDERLVNEGWNPTTAEYWSELDARVKKYLPHRAKAGYNNSQPNRPRVPVAGSNRDTGGGNKTSYHLSAERVSALKDAGVWENPEMRADAIKRVKEYDAANAANN